MVKCERQTHFFCINKAFLFVLMVLNNIEMVIRDLYLQLWLLSRFHICEFKNLLDKSSWNFHWYPKLNKSKLNSSSCALSFYSIAFLFLLYSMDSWHYYLLSHQCQNPVSYPRLLLAPITSNLSPNTVDFCYHMTWSWTHLIFSFLLYNPIRLCHHLTSGLLSSQLLSCPPVLSPLHYSKNGLLKIQPWSC